ncbi:acyl-CoA thioesterase [Rhodococcus pyridinivorans]|uniref:acyl-CoA thioesterase n=1 Tax=Rhodococcus pyridinivorans TaxID=103816 RepID=UPI001E3FBAE3|nr:thioesterase family protein [Rhodococcus pyridinivorans]MCD5418595.1 acyl-CoA thioesterase [Rhodococcus pyridinivorans]
MTERNGHRPYRCPVEVRKMDVEFLRPIKDSSAPIEVETTVLRLGTSSFTVRQTILDRDSVVCAVADTVLVGFDPETDMSQPLTDEVRAVLDRHRAVTPTG